MLHTGGYDTKQGVQTERSSHLNRRKNLRAKAEREHGRPTQWKDGTLIFTDTGESVPGVPRVPKPQRSALD